MRTLEELKTAPLEEVAKEYRELKTLYRQLVGTLYPAIAYEHLMSVYRIYFERKGPDDPYLPYPACPTNSGHTPPV